MRMTRRALLAGLTAFALAGCRFAGAPEGGGYDLVIVGGQVMDGSGKPAAAADVGVRDGRIAFVGKLPASAKAKKRLNAAGKIVSPGFIDLHTHADGGLQDRNSCANVNFVMQGITTTVTGNCGGGPTNVAKYFETLESHGIGTNCIHLIPHGDVKEQAMGDHDRPPTAEEMEKMKSVVEQGMKDGAWGMSTGLWYVPGTYAKTEEIIELAKIVAAHGGLYASHMRNEAEHVMEAVEETLRIGKEAGCAVHISHIKAASPAMWGRAPEIAKLVEDAQKAGQKVSADQYPYDAWSTDLDATVIPAWAREGGNQELIRRFDDPTEGPRAREETGKIIRDLGGPQTVYITGGKYAGKNLKEIGEAESKDAVAVVEQIQRSGGAGVVAHVMNEKDIAYFMKKEWVATATDTGTRAFGSGMPHPRGYGTCPRKIGFYGREQKTITLPFAVRSCSGLPADILGLQDRGYVRAGCWADLVVFDPDRIIDKATYEKPHQWNEGIDAVLVNGTLVVKNGQPTKALPGRVLRRP